MPRENPPQAVTLPAGSMLRRLKITALSGAASAGLVLGVGVVADGRQALASAGIGAAIAAAVNMRAAYRGVRRHQRHLASMERFRADHAQRMAELRAGIDHTLS